MSIFKKFILISLSLFLIILLLAPKNNLNSQASSCPLIDSYLIWSGPWQPGYVTMQSRSTYTLITTDIYYNTSTRSVGIGTTSPTRKLEVLGGIKTDELCLNNDCKRNWPTGGSGQNFWLQSGNNLYPSSTLWNVGIGTTNPTRKLEVLGGIKTDELCLNNDCKRNWPTGGSGQNFWLQSGNNLYPSSTLWNVGIGTTNPQAKLDVNGNAIVRGGMRVIALTTTSPAGFYYYNQENRTDFKIYHDNDTPGWAVLRSDSGKIGFEVIPDQIGLSIVKVPGGPGDIARGFARRGAYFTGIGIGTTSPAYLLDVAGTFRARGGIISGDFEVRGKTDLLATTTVKTLCLSGVCRSSWPDIGQNFWRLSNNILTPSSTNWDVYIGTSTSPYRKLEVAGSIVSDRPMNYPYGIAVQVDGNWGGWARQIGLIIKDPTATNPQQQQKPLAAFYARGFSTTTNGVYIGKGIVWSGGQHIADPNPWISIDPQTGNIGIGTGLNVSNLQDKLRVNGSVRVTGTTTVGSLCLSGVCRNSWQTGTAQEFWQLRQISTIEEDKAPKIITSTILTPSDGHWQVRIGIPGSHRSKLRVAGNIISDNEPSLWGFTGIGVRVSSRVILSTPLQIGFLRRDDTKATSYELGRDKLLASFYIKHDASDPSEPFYVNIGGGDVDINNRLNYPWLTIKPSSGNIGIGLKQFGADRIPEYKLDVGGQIRERVIADRKTSFLQMCIKNKIQLEYIPTATGGLIYVIGTDANGTPHGTVPGVGNCQTIEGSLRTVPAEALFYSWRWTDIPTSSSLIVEAEDLDPAIKCGPRLVIEYYQRNSGNIIKNLSSINCYPGDNFKHRYIRLNIDWTHYPAVDDTSNWLGKKSNKILILNPNI